MKLNLTKEVKYLDVVLVNTWKAFVRAQVRPGAEDSIVMQCIHWQDLEIFAQGGTVAAQTCDNV